MVWMSGGSEIVHDSDTRQLKILELFFAHKLFRSFGSRAWFLLRRFGSFDLRFDVLAFPAACHAYSVTQNCKNRGRIRREKRRKSIRRRRRGAGGGREEQGASRCGWWSRRRARDARQI